MMGVESLITRHSNLHIMTSSVRGQIGLYNFYRCFVNICESIAADGASTVFVAIVAFLFYTFPLPLSPLADHPCYTNHPHWTWWGKASAPVCAVCGQSWRMDSLPLRVETASIFHCLTGRLNIFKG